MRDEPADEPEPEPPVRSAPKPRRTRATPRATPRAIDCYLVELARMPESELAGELKKHLRTIAKFEGQYWLDKPGGPCDKLMLVEREIDARGSSITPNARPRSQAHSAGVQVTLF